MISLGRIQSKVTACITLYDKHPMQEFRKLTLENGIEVIIPITLPECKLAEHLGQLTFTLWPKE